MDITFALILYSPPYNEKLEMSAPTEAGLYNECFQFPIKLLLLDQIQTLRVGIVLP